MRIQMGKVQMVSHHKKLALARFTKQYVYQIRIMHWMFVYACKYVWMRHNQSEALADGKLAWFTWEQNEQK